MSGTGSIYRGAIENLEMDNCRYRDENNVLKAENARLRAVLEKIANPIYKYGTPSQDPKSLAREALEGEKE